MQETEATMSKHELDKIRGDQRIQKIANKIQKFQNNIKNKTYTKTQQNNLKDV